jgi:hypothetical protein
VSGVAALAPFVTFVPIPDYIDDPDALTDSNFLHLLLGSCLSRTSVTLCGSLESSSNYLKRSKGRFIQRAISSLIRSISD